MGQGEEKNMKKIFWLVLISGIKPEESHQCRVANPAKDLIVAFAEDDSSILTIDSSNAWRVVITP